MMDDPNSLETLRLRRLELERNCTDPAAWLELAQAFTEIGALCAAASCQARADYYAAESDATEAEWEIASA